MIRFILLLPSNPIIFQSDSSSHSFFSSLLASDFVDLSCMFFTQISTNILSGGTTAFNTLPEPDASLPISDLLVHALAPLSDDNPADRTSAAFENFVLNADRAMNLLEITVTIKNALPGQFNSQEMFHKVINRLANHIGQWKIHQTHAHWWARVSADFDLVLSRHFGDQARKGTSRENFIAANEHSIGCIMSVDAVKEVESREDKEEPPEIDAMRKLMVFELGRTIFAKECSLVQVSLFEEQSKKGIEDLEHNNYALAEIQAFIALTNRRVERLLADGHKPYCKNGLQVQWLGREIQVPSVGLADKALVRMHLAVKCVAWNTHKVLRTPWEALLHGEEQIVGVPTAIQLEDSIPIVSKNRQAIEMYVL